MGEDLVEKPFVDGEREGLKLERLINEEMGETGVWGWGMVVGHL